MKFTVLLLVPDYICDELQGTYGQTTLLCHVVAENVVQALAYARNQAVAEFPAAESDDFYPLFTAAGHQDNLVLWGEPVEAT